MTTLKAALQEAYFMELEEMPSEEKLSEDEALTFSSAFERKMKRLIRRADHPIRYRIAQIAACLLLAALLSGCTVLAVSPEARAAVVGWIKEFQQKWYSYQYVGERDAVLKDTIYCPTWLPEGYQEIKAPKLGNFVYALYENENGSRLAFTYQVGLEELTFRVEWEKAQIQHPFVGKTQADLFLNTAGGANAIVWTDEAKGAVFLVAAQLDGKDLVRVAESVRESAPMGWIYRPTWFPPDFYIDTSIEVDGEGDTVYRTSDGALMEFCYSKSGKTPYASRTDGQNITLKNGTAMLYPAGQVGTGQILTWSDRDTGYAFWLTAEIPTEDMVRFAESVQIYMHSIDSIFESSIIDEDMISKPLYGKVDTAMTDEFVSQIEKWAKCDAQMGVYMSSGYEKMIKAYGEEHISPERYSAIIQVSSLLESDQASSDNILCLVEPFCFANIRKSEYGTYAHIFDENGIMIAGYISVDKYTTAGEYNNIDEYIDANGYPRADEYIIAGGLWTPVPTIEEMLYNYHVTQIYYTAYNEAKVDMSHK